MRIKIKEWIMGQAHSAKMVLSELFDPEKLSREELLEHATDEERSRLDWFADSLSCGRRSRALLARIRKRLQT